VPIGRGDSAGRFRSSQEALITGFVSWFGLTAKLGFACG
jgi:hypothetical protein